MLTTTLALVMCAALAWLMIMTPTIIRLKLWTLGGFKLASGNRELLPVGRPWVGRAERASRNMLENMILFIALVAAVHFAGKTGPRADLGATIFFWARFAYWLAYFAGIPYLRTTLWSTGVVGMLLIGLAAIA